jgi:branched-subunit amino acid transport protein AzlD
MTNDTYLVVSYVVCAALSIALGTLVYLFLRRPFAVVADAAPRKNLLSILKRLFPIGLLFPALLGFVSVSYQSCDRQTYAKIVESRSYLVQKNQEQISSTLLSIVVAVLVWDVVILLLAKLAQRDSNSQ